MRKYFIYLLLILSVLSLTSCTKLLTSFTNVFGPPNIEGTWRNRSYDSYYEDYFVEDFVIYNQSGESFSVNAYAYLESSGKDNSYDEFKGKIDKEGNITITIYDSDDTSIKGKYKDNKLEFTVDGVWYTFNKVE